MWTQRFIQTVQYRPMDAIGFILAFLAFVAGVYLVLLSLHVFGIGLETATSARVSGHDWLPLIFAALQLGLGGAWIYALFNKGKAWSVRVRRACAMTFFIVYMFYGFSGVFLYGLERATWLSTFALAAITGVKYLYLTTVGDQDGS